MSRVAESTGSGISNASQSISSGTHPVTRQYANYWCDSTAGAITLTAPASPLLNDEYLAKDVTGQAGTNPISWDPNGHNLDGVSGVQSVISIAYGWARFKFNGTQWSQV